MGMRGRADLQAQGFSPTGALSAARSTGQGVPEAKHCNPAGVACVRSAIEARLGESSPLDHLVKEPDVTLQRIRYQRGGFKVGFV